MREREEVVLPGLGLVLDAADGMQEFRRRYSRTRFEPEALRNEAHTGAVPEQQLDAIGALRAEHIDDAGEWLEFQLRRNERR